MIRIHDKETTGMTFEITQREEFGTVNVDAIASTDNFQEAEYYFEVPAGALLDFLLSYQEEQGII